MTARWSLASLLWTCCAGVMAVYLLVFGLNAATVLVSPLEHIYGESIILAEVRRVASGQPLYQPLTDLPLTISGYMPLYYLLVGSLQRLTGLDGYGIGRTVSLTATLYSAGLVAWGVHGGARCWRGQFLAAGLFLTQNLTVFLWAPLHRVDMLGLALTVTGLALAARGRPIVAALPLALALLTKQTFLSAPLAVCLSLAMGRQWRALLGFTALLGGIVAPAIGIANFATDGWFAWHTVTANANPLNLEYFATIVGSFLQFNALSLCLAAAVFALPTMSGERVWRAYFLLSAALTLATIGKIGASSNYWLEVTLATAVLTGIVASRISRESMAAVPFRPAGLAAGVLASLLMAVPAYQANVTAVVERYFAPEKVLWQLPVASHIASQPGELLTDDPGLALLAGKSIEFESIIFTILATQGIWDEQPILNAVRSRRFTQIVLTMSLDSPQEPPIAARWTETVRQAMRESYEATGYESGYWWYRPK